jgi:LmbE family N-acetylglucosaminyl deacetylase
MRQLVGAFLERAITMARRSRATVERDYVPKRALLVAAHPDDPEHFCAGTIAQWVRHGAEVRYVVCTSGQAGSRDLSRSRDEVARIRESEQVAAAAATGVTDVVFFGLEDGLLENTLELRRALVREIRRFRPNVVMMNDPRIFFADDFINHPDHRAAAEAALAAVYPSAGNPRLFGDLSAEGLEAHKVDRVYIHTWLKPNVWRDITETIETKLSALEKHVSQRLDKDSQKIRNAAARSARFTGVRYAETFRVIQLKR